MDLPTLTLTLYRGGENGRERSMCQTRQMLFRWETLLKGEVDLQKQLGLTF